MKKEKVIRLTENDLVNIIKRVLSEQTTTDQASTSRNELSHLTGSEVIMYNAAGVNKYTGEKGVLKQYETYKIGDVWFPQIKGGITVAFNVTPVGEDSTSSLSGKTGLLKGAFKRESKDTSLPIQFRWDCYAYFEKGLGGKGQELRRYGGIKQDYINNDLAKVIVTRPFCNYKANPEYVVKITPNQRYAGAPR